MTLEQITQFLAVADTLNFTRAGELLYLSHTTVSRSVSAMENELGVKLMERSTKNVSLTPAGRELQRQAVRLFDAMRQMEADVRRVGGAEREKLTIASVNIFCPRVFAAFQRFQKERPDKELNILPAQPGKAYEMVSSGKAQLGLAFSFELEGKQELRMFPVADGEFCALVSARHPLAAEDAVSVDDERLTAPILLEGLQSAWLERIVPRSSTKRPASTSLEQLLMRVKADMGIAVLPEHTAAEAGSGCHRLRLLGAETSYQIIVFVFNSTQREDVEAFLHML